MNQYENSTRGVIQCEEYAKQLVSYGGLVFKGKTGHYNVTPTDIDGLIQLDNENCFIVIELKHSGDAPEGQKKALQNLAAAIRKGGSNCVVMLAEHGTPCPDTIIAKDAIVKYVDFNGKWIPMRESRTLKEMIDDYIEWIKENP